MARSIPITLMISFLLSFNVFGADGSLPPKANNALRDHFPRIIEQRGGCCTQVTLTTYGLAYELNRALGRSAQKAEHQFPAYFTWNFLNNGDGEGTLREDGSARLASDSLHARASIASRVSRRHRLAA